MNSKASSGGGIGLRIKERKNPLSLSLVVGRMPSLFDGEKLSLVGVDLHTIDNLGQKLSRGVKILYLSNNYLTTLGSIDQFEKLVAVSLTNNFIRYLDELQPLSRLKSLQKVSLQGNIVTKMPYYREHVITLCPTLTSLDGVKITVVDRAQAKLVFFKIKSFYDQLRLNEFRNSVLIHISKLMACHLELRQQVLGKFKHILSAHIGDTHFPAAIASAASTGGAGGDIGEDSGLNHFSSGGVSSSNTSRGAGSVLQQALRGGVYRWLQTMASRHFNHLVQDNLYKLLLATARSDAAEQVSQQQQQQQQQQQSPVWDSVVADYLKEQQEFFLELVEYCEVLSTSGDASGAAASSGGGGGGGTAQDLMRDALDNEVLMDCMGQLQFLANNSSSHTSAPTAVTHPSNRDQRTATVSSHIPQQRQNIAQSVQPTGNPHYSRSGDDDGMCGVGSVTTKFPGTESHNTAISQQQQQREQRGSSSPVSSRPRSQPLNHNNNHEGGYSSSGSKRVANYSDTKINGTHNIHNTGTAPIDRVNYSAIYSQGVVSQGQADIASSEQTMETRLLIMQQQEEVHQRYAALLQTMNSRSSSSNDNGAKRTAGTAGRNSTRSRSSSPPSSHRPSVPNYSSSFNNNNNNNNNNNTDKDGHRYGYDAGVGGSSSAGAGAGAGSRLTSASLPPQQTDPDGPPDGPSVGPSAGPSAGRSATKHISLGYTNTATGTSASTSTSTSNSTSNSNPNGSNNSNPNSAISTAGYSSRGHSQDGRQHRNNVDQAHAHAHVTFQLPATTATSYVANISDASGSNNPTPAVGMLAMENSAGYRESSSSSSSSHQQQLPPPSAHAEAIGALLDEQPADIEAFVRRSLVDSAALAAEARADELVPSGAGGCSRTIDLSFSQDIETRWRLAAAAIGAYIESDQYKELVRNQQQLFPRPFDRAVEATTSSSSSSSSSSGAGVAASASSNMSSLKTLIQSLSGLYMLSQREEHRAFELHRTLAGAVQLFVQQSTSVADAGANGLRAQREEVRTLQKEVQHATIWLDVHQVHLQQLEEMKEKIADAKSRQESLLQEEQLLEERMNEAAALKNKLTTSLGDVQDAIRIVATELKTDPHILALTKKQKQLHMAEQFWTSRTRALQRKVFRMLRQCTRRQRKIRDFHAALLARRGGAARMVCFAAWRNVLRVTHRGTILQTWKLRRRKTLFFRKWRQEFLRISVKHPAIHQRMQRHRLQSAFYSLMHQSKQCRLIREQDQRYELYVSLFRSIRIFRAWKMWVQRDRARREVLLLQSRRRRQQQVLHAWREEALQQRRTAVDMSQFVHTQANLSRRRHALQNWLSVFQFRVLLTMYRKKKRAFARFHRHIAASQRQKALSDMAVEGAGRRVSQRAQAQALRHWRDFAALSRQCSCARSSVQALRERRMAQSVWSKWQGLSRHFRQLTRRLITQTMHSNYYTVRRHFLQWRALMNFQLQARLTRNASTASTLLRQHHMESFYAKMQNGTYTAGSVSSGAEGTIATGTGGRGGRVSGRDGSTIAHPSKLKSSMTPVEFEMLYLDDDDDDDAEEDDCNNDCQQFEEEAKEKEEEEGTAEVGVQTYQNRQKKKKKNSYSPRAGTVDGAPSALALVRRSSVLVRRYLWRWRARGLRLRSLRVQAQRLALYRDRCTIRRAFSGMTNERAMAMADKIQDITSYLQSPAVVELSKQELGTRRVELETLAGAEQQKQSGLRVEIDALSITETEARQQIEQLDTALMDVSHSVSSLRMEHTSLQERIRKAKMYVEYVKALQEKHLQGNTTTRGGSDGVENPDSAMDASSDAARDEDHQDKAIGNKSIASGDANVVVSTSTSVAIDVENVDERLLLMQDVESLYQTAVAAQERGLRRQQHLQAQREAAAAAAAQRRQQVQQVQARTAVVLEERHQVEATLRECTLALEEAFRKVAAQTEYHEAVLSDLTKEESLLRARLALLLSMEQRLKGAVEDAQQQRGAAEKRHRSSSRYSSSSSSRSHLSPSPNAPACGSERLHLYAPVPVPVQPLLSASSSSSSSSRAGGSLRPADMARSEALSIEYVSHVTAQQQQQQSTVAAATLPKGAFTADSDSSAAAAAAAAAALLVDGGVNRGRGGTVTASIMLGDDGHQQYRQVANAMVGGSSAAASVSSTEKPDGARSSTATATMMRKRVGRSSSGRNRQQTQGTGSTAAAERGGTGENVSRQIGSSTTNTNTNTSRGRTTNTGTTGIGRRSIGTGIGGTNINAGNRRPSSRNGDAMGSAKKWGVSDQLHVPVAAATGGKENLGSSSKVRAPVNLPPPASATKITSSSSGSGTGTALRAPTATATATALAAHHYQLQQQCDDDVGRQIDELSSRIRQRFSSV